MSSTDLCVPSRRRTIGNIRAVLPITKARINLGDIAKRAHVKGEYFILEKDGIPVIGIMDADELGLPAAARPKGPGSHQTGHRGISSW